MPAAATALATAPVAAPLPPVPDATRLAALTASLAASAADVDAAIGLERSRSLVAAGRLALLR